MTPQQIKKARNLSVFGDYKDDKGRAYIEPEKINIAADPIISYMSKEKLEKSIEHTRKLMKKAAKDLDFIEAAQYRDELHKLEELLKERD